MSSRNLNFTPTASHLVRAILCIVAAAMLCSCAVLPMGSPAPAGDFYTVTTTAKYQPVPVPGAQRRDAQARAEEEARNQIMTYVGRMPAGNGTETVFDVMARDSRLRADVLKIVRMAEVVDWKVVPECGTVQVWVRVDLNCIRAIVAGCH